MLHRISSQGMRALVLATAVAVLIVMRTGDVPAVANQAGSAELSFGVIAAPNVSCSSTDKPDSCTVEPGTPFTITADVHLLPEEGFSGFQVEVVHEGLIAMDVRYVVPDFTTFGVLGLGTDRFGVGGVTQLSPPIPKTTYLGPLVEADFDCSATISSFEISMPVPDTNLITQFSQSIPITTVQHDTLKVADTLTIHCATKLAYPGDSDGDGCPDERENLPEAQADQGGGRDWQDPNDYFDVSVPRDGVIDLSNDILGVILHYAPGGTEPTYDVNFDRGPTAGPNPWNMTAPDGVIDLSNDILGVIQQYQNNC